MNFSKILLTSLLAVVLMGASATLADLSNTWNFSTPASYSVSATKDIEVADGVAKLRLQATKLSNSDATSYVTNASMMEELSIGSDVSLRLTQQAGLYSVAGEFVSRVIDGGVGNVWREMKATAYNTVLENALGEVEPPMTGLKSLLHLNNSWKDEISGAVGSPTLTASFSTSAKLGSHSGDFTGAGLVSLPGSIGTPSAFTIVLWLRAETTGTGQFQLPLHFNSGGSFVAYLTVGGYYSVAMQPNSIAMYCNGQYSSSSSTFYPASDTMVWRHIAVVYDSSKTPRMRFYKDAKEIPNANDRIAGNFPAHNQLVIGQSWDGWIDEVMVFDRALTSREVFDLYRRPQSLLFQIRADETPEALSSASFVGPDLSPQSYYDATSTELYTGGGFKSWGRYLQYRTRFAGPRDGSRSPHLDAMALLGTRARKYDNTLSDFSQGQLVSVEPYPSNVDSPHLRLAKAPNGGFLNSGTYTSRVLDGGVGTVFWDRLSWGTAAELATAEPYIEALWHLNGGTADGTGHGYTGTGTDVAYTALTPKLGREAAEFNGISSRIDVDMGGVDIAALQFWVNPNAVDGGLLQLSSGLNVTIENSQIVLNGFPGADVEMFVNGNPYSRTLTPGWNHVGITLAAGTSMSADDVVLGYAAGQYFDGMLDEVAFYNGPLSGSDIKAHYVSGGRKSSGSVGVMVRASNSNPPTEAFVGVGGSLSEPFRNPGGAVLPQTVWQKRYFQYRVFMDGDGTVSPIVNSVTVDFSGDSSGTYVDDTAAEFAEGDFGGGATVWAGEELGPFDMSTAPGLINADPLNMLGLQALWHMDEEEWTAGSTIMDASANGRNGDPQNGATTVLQPQVGAACGYFNGANQFAILPAITLGDRFTVGGWFRTASSGRSAFLARSDRRYMIEINGDGSSHSEGAITFVVRDSSGNERKIVGKTGPVNDDRWHNATAVRDGQAIYLYIDGRPVGSTYVGDGFEVPGVGQLEVARHPSLGTYLMCYVDEVMVFSRALSEGEIRQNMAVGYNITSDTLYVSKVIDAGGPAIWEEIAWSEPGPFGEPMQEADNVVALWHLNSITNGNQVVDDSAFDNTGTVQGPTVSSSGRFGGALLFDGINDRVTLQNDSLPASGSVSVEAWVRMNRIDNRAIFDKRNSTSGFALSTDGDGHPVFWVNGTACVGSGGVRPTVWNHLAGVYDGRTIRVYLNGEVGNQTSSTNTSLGNAAAMLGESAYSGSFAGLMDEVAVHDKALNAEEIADRARAGFSRILFQGRAGDSPNLDAVPFVGPDGTTNSYFDVGTGSALQGSIPLGRYFQYRFVTESENGLWPPIVEGITIKQSRYPGDNPWVRPAAGFGVPFFGRILEFDHVLQTNTDDNVRYQLSGDGTSWFYWNGTQWARDDLAAGWAAANEVSEINSRISLFYDQQYPKVGGTFYFKAFLHSAGNDQTAIDEVSIGYSTGRITVLSPNGTERDQRAWLVDTPYTITWESAGLNSNQLRIQYSRDGGQTWVLIAQNEADDGIYQGWVTPQAPSTAMLVRITDQNDASITDQSDATFHLVDIFQVKVPNGGEVWYLTDTTNAVKWISPGSAAARGGKVDIRYAADGVNFNFLVKAFVDNIQGSHNNAYVWYATPGVFPMPLPSLTGKIRVHAADNTDPNFNGQDDSDAVFTLAGITVVNPGEESYINNGKDVDLTWVSALAGAKVGVDFSRDNGATWTNVLAEIDNSTGVNHYPWLVNLAPSDTARIRIRSLSDGRIWGISGTFQLADIKVTYPRPGESWELRQNHTIRWESGGAGNRVDLYYSLDSGGSWTTIKSNVVNVASNAYAWTVAPFPSGNASIRVVAHADRENLWDASDDFNIAGVRVAFPTGGEVWPMNGTDAIRWEFTDAGSEGAIYVSLNGGTSWEYLGARGLGNYQINWRPLYPSARALARIESVNPPDWAVDMTDQSDEYFTVGGVKVLSPTNSQLLTIGQQGSISWVSAGSLQVSSNEFADLYYTGDGGVTSNRIAIVGNNENYPGVNAYVWNIPGSLPPSESAQVIVAAPPYRGFSDPFTLRGMRFTSPSEGQVVDIGGDLMIQWDYAGLDDSAAGFIFLSSDGGATFSGAAINAERVSVPGGVYDWDVPSNSVPSTNAVLKFVIDASDAPADIGYEVKSQPFIMRGLKIMTPGLGSVLPHASANQIHLVASRAGDFATIYYSPDGVSYDTTPVARNYPFKDGSTYIPWTVEKTRLPSASARLKAVSTIATTVSEPFTVEGVQVLRPLSTDIWAAGEENSIRWKGQGTSGSYTITVEHDGLVRTVATGYSGSSITWVADAALVGTGVVVRVRDTGPKGYEGVSEPFRIVAQPTVIVTAPTAGDHRRVSDTYSIIWSRGGQMTNDFTVSYASEPYSDWKEISGSPAFDEESNSFSMPWTVPDFIGPTRIRVQNNVLPAILDESPTFYIVGKFQVIFPNGGEQTLFSRKPATLSWYTWGSVNYVNLYYSADPLHEEGSWVRINSTPVPNPGRGTEPSTYEWEVVDHGGLLETVRIRVEQADRPGAYDDSNADFPVRYYTITWFVVDEKTGENLNNLSVTESHGKSDSGLTSPVVRKYPWGFFDSVWSREYFYDYVQFNWKSEPSRSIQVIMKRSDVDPDYNVFADFTYKGGSNDILQIHTWLERAGATLVDPDFCTVHIYDENGAAKTQLTAGETLLDSGVFKFSWQNVTDTLTRGETYFAKVDIDYSGQTYSSIITYTLRLTAEEADTANLADDLAALSNAQADFRASTTAALGNILTNTSEIADSVASLETNLLAAVVPALNTISNEIMTVIGPTLSNTWAAVSTFEGQIDAATARILTRDTTIAQGSPLTVLYKTAAGYGNGNVDFEVRTSAGGGPLISRKMNETVPGIYQYELTGAETAARPLGYYMLVCRDPGDKARDSTTMRIVAEDLYNAPVMLAAMSNDLARMTVDLSRMADNLLAVTNAAAQLDQLIQDLSALTNLDALATAIQDFDIDALTNVVALSDKIDAIGVDVTTVRDSIGSLTNLSEIADRLEKLDLSTLTNFAGIASSIDGISAVVDSIQMYSVGMSNEFVTLHTQLSDQMGAITNIDANVENIQLALGSMTNMGAIVDAIDKLNVDALTNINAVVDDIATLQTMVSGLSTNVDLLPEISARVVTIEGTVSNLTALGASVDALLPALASITNAVGGISTNLADVSGMLATVNGLEASMSSLTNRVLSLSTNMVAVRDELAFVAGSVTNLSALSSTNLASLSGLSESLGQMTNDLRAMKGSIRTPDLSMTNGATETVLYKTTPNAAPGQVVLKVTSATDGRVIVSGRAMTEIADSDGIYKYDLSIPADLPIGTYALTVEDRRDSSRDSTPLNVVPPSEGSGDSRLITPDLAMTNGATGRILYKAVPGAKAGEVALQVTDEDGKVVQLKGRSEVFMTAVKGAPGIYEYDLEVPMGLPMASYYVTVKDARTPNSSDTTLLEVVESTDSATDAALAALTRTVGGIVDRLGLIDSSLSVIGSDASDAASKSQQAKSQAAAAATGVSALQEALESGDLAEILPAVQNMMGLLEDAKANVDEIPGLIGPERYHDQMLEMAGVIEDLAVRKGFKDFLQMESLGGPGAEGEAGAGADKDSIGVLSRNLEEMRLSMNLMQKLMDEKLYEPVVEETLLGVE